tara:strand:+ start:43 stop:1185 length:1143 start_codon:yes stop_codon:yes gene_type:complete
MTKLVWALKNETTATTFTDIVLNFNVMVGRKNYLDDYNGHILAIQINNDSNQASDFTLNDQISLKTGFFNQTFFVQGILFQDSPGNTGFSIATLQCSDWLARAGRIQANNVTLPLSFTGKQLDSFEAAAGGPLPSSMTVAPFASYGDSIASPATYTGSVGSRVQLNLTTEKGIMFYDGAILKPLARSSVDNWTAAYSFSYEDPVSNIAYQTFERIQNGINMMNFVQVSPAGLATQTAEDTTSSSLYGQNGYSLSTVDLTTSQALDLASWLAYSQSDPNDLRFVIGFSDVSQNATKLGQFVAAISGQFGYLRSTTLTYQIQKKTGLPIAAQTESVVMEGVQITATPSETLFQVFFSPLTQYQFFILDSSTLGILDTSRLGF